VHQVGNLFIVKHTSIAVALTLNMVQCLMGNSKRT